MTIATNNGATNKVEIVPFAGVWDIRVIPPYFHCLASKKTKEEAIAWAEQNGKEIVRVK